MKRLIVLSGIAALVLFGCGSLGDDGGVTRTQMGGSIQGAPLSLTTVVTTLAGAALVPNSTDATGTAARFNYPTDITTDGTNLYVADSENHTIRVID